MKYLHCYRWFYKVGEVGCTETAAKLPDMMNLVTQCCKIPTALEAFVHAVEEVKWSDAEKLSDMTIVK